MASESLPSGDEPEVYHISVLGMGGVGKTSFTNRVGFNHYFVYPISHYMSRAEPNC